MDQPSWQCDVRVVEDVWLHLCVDVEGAVVYSFLHARREARGELGCKSKFTPEI